MNGLDLLLIAISLFLLIVLAVALVAWDRVSRELDRAQRRVRRAEAALESYKDDVWRANADARRRAQTARLDAFLDDLLGGH